jgi:hypothetical protein
MIRVVERQKAFFARKSPAANVMGIRSFAALAKA